MPNRKSSPDEARILVMKRPTSLIERDGVNAVEHIFLNEFEWFFREQTISDHGVDAQIEELDVNHRPTGKLIALQIKTGASYFKKRGNDYVYSGELRHLEYWSNHSLPCYIILHNPVSGLTLWQKVERRLATISDDRWSIVIPATNVLDKAAKKYFEREVATDAEAVRRFNMAFDRDTIELLSEQEFRIDDWVNKTLNMRGVNVYFDEDDKDEADLQIDISAPTHGYVDFMDRYFPWLDFEHIETEDTMSAEIEIHVLKVTVNELGKGYLALEDYYANGRETPEPDPSESLFPNDNDR